MDNSYFSGKVQAIYPRSCFRWTGLLIFIWVETTEVLGGSPATRKWEGGGSSNPAMQRVGNSRT
jgi:hypothetical protein